MIEKSFSEAFDRMAINWPSEFIARTKIEEFTGGMITGKTVANYESRGEGPPKILIGRKAGYPKRLFVEWLKGRAVLCD